MSKLAAARYLGGILELPTFWDRKFANNTQSKDGRFHHATYSFRGTSELQQSQSDEMATRLADFHPFLKRMCKLGVVLLQDLCVDVTQPVTVDDLVTFDIVGIHNLLHEFLGQMPTALKLLRSLNHDARTAESLSHLSALVEKLQRQVAYFFWSDE